jgi:CrcB protein
MKYVLVFIGGGLGSTLRHLVNVVCPRVLGANFPYHTFIINITGSTIMGLIAGYFAFKGDASQSWRLFVMTGILGGYTTFSAFSLDSACAALRGGIGRAFDSGTVRRPHAGSPTDMSRKRSAWASSIRDAWGFACAMAREAPNGLQRCQWTPVML